MNRQNDVSDNNGPRMTDSDEDIFIGIVLTYYGIVENKKTMPGMAESWMRQKKTTAWNDIHEHFVKATSKNTSVNSLQNKWNSIKKLARDRAKLVNQMKETGGGSLTAREKRIANSTLYADIVQRLNVSATGMPARLDSDGTNSINFPTQRLAKCHEKNILEESSPEIGEVDVDVVVNHRDQIGKLQNHIDMLKSHNESQNEFLREQINISEQILEVRNEKLRLMNEVIAKRIEKTKKDIKEVKETAMKELHKKSHDLGLGSLK